jgi:hypothetical protein
MFSSFFRRSKSGSKVVEPKVSEASQQPKDSVPKKSAMQVYLENNTEIESMGLKNSKDSIEENLLPHEVAIGFKPQASNISEQPLIGSLSTRNELFPNTDSPVLHKDSSSNSTNSISSKSISVHSGDRINLGETVDLTAVHSALYNQKDLPNELNELNRDLNPLIKEVNVAEVDSHNQNHLNTVANSESTFKGISKVDTANVTNSLDPQKIASPVSSSVALSPEPVHTANESLATPDNFDLDAVVSPDKQGALGSTLNQSQPQASTVPGSKLSTPESHTPQSSLQVPSLAPAQGPPAAPAPAPENPSVPISTNKKDVVTAYKIFLRRFPESPDVIEPRVGIPRERLLGSFIMSGEHMNQPEHIKLIFEVAQEIIAKAKLTQSNDQAQLQVQGQGKAQ